MQYKDIVVYLKVGTYIQIFSPSRSFLPQKVKSIYLLVRTKQYHQMFVIVYTNLGKHRLEEVQATIGRGRKENLF